MTPGPNVTLMTMDVPVSRRRSASTDPHTPEEN